jgi:LiaI-LiaF-like transmembrane region/B-box zinc finger
MNCAIHNQTQAVAYCRTCGKALCEDCRRDVMGAIYCEPCIAARLQGQAAPGATVAPQPAPVPGAPSPIIAGLLGFVPGVGAMYNGQFAKAFAHVVIFVLLIVATDRFGLFGILIGFFVFYMAFEAYKTAEARRLGIPAPDPLGLDKMFGVQDSQAHHSAGPAVINTSAYPPAQTAQIEPPPPPRDNAPIGAVVLIAMGVIFLLDNLGVLRMHHLWPLFLIGIGLWIAYKRTIQPSAGGTR